ncbi:MAG: hypothetical protein ACXWV1_02890, partial [Chitinophagaceae bacterium]
NTKCFRKQGEFYEQEEDTLTGWWWAFFLVALFVGQIGSISVQFQNFEVGYTLPTTILQKAGIGSFRVFASGINLITWDKLGIFDPEAISGSGQYYPQSRVLNIGASVTF